MNIGIMGTHGVGKSTTIKNLLNLPNVEMYEGIGDDHGNPITDPVWARQLWRLGKYISDYTEALTSDTDPQKIRLIDRCPFDWKAYTETFYLQDEISWYHREKFNTIFNTFEGLEILPPYVIFIHPPYEWVVDRIKQRWNEEKKKWREDDFEYLKTLRRQYELIATEDRLVGRTEFLTITETNLNDRIEIITDWFYQNNGPWTENAKIFQLETE